MSPEEAYRDLVTEIHYLRQALQVIEQLAAKNVDLCARDRRLSAVVPGFRTIEQIARDVLALARPLGTRT